MGNFIEVFINDMRLRNFSRKTIKSYSRAVEELSGFYQKPLGRQNIRTTQIYTKVANPAIKNIKSPL